MSAPGEQLLIRSDYFLISKHTQLFGPLPFCFRLLSFPL
jgi:hypothetical protein